MSLFNSTGYLLPLPAFRDNLANGADPNEIYRRRIHSQKIHPKTDDSFELVMPLLSAAKASRHWHLKLLLAHPTIDLRAGDQAGRNALQLAIEYGDIETIRLLCEAGMNVNAHDHAFRTPLHEAIYRPGVDAIEVLLEYGADPDLRDFAGFTPLLRVMTDDSLYFRAPCEARAKTLIQAGCSVDLPDHEGNTPLFAAAAQAKANAVAFLLEHGADPDLRNQDGERPIDAVRRLVSYGPGRHYEALVESLRVLTLHTRAKLATTALIGIARRASYEEVARRM